MRWPRSLKGECSSTPDLRQSRSGSVSCRERSEEKSNRGPASYVGPLSFSFLGPLFFLSARPFSFLLCPRCRSR